MIPFTSSTQFCFSSTYSIFCALGLMDDIKFEIFSPFRLTEQFLLNSEHEEKVEKEKRFRLPSRFITNKYKNKWVLCSTRMKINGAVPMLIIIIQKKKMEEPSNAHFFQFVYIKTRAIFA